MDGYYWARATFDVKVVRLSNGAVLFQKVVGGDEGTLDEGRGLKAAGATQEQASRRALTLASKKMSATLIDGLKKAEVPTTN